VYCIICISRKEEKSNLEIVKNGKKEKNVGIYKYDRKTETKLGLNAVLIRRRKKMKNQNAD